MFLQKKKIFIISRFSNWIPFSSIFDRLSAVLSGIGRPQNAFEARNASEKDFLYFREI